MSKKNSYCMYGTYQRATSGYLLRELNHRLIIRLIRAKFKKEAQRDRKYRDGRHAHYRGAIKHWENDMKTLNLFRL